MDIEANEKLNTSPDSTDHVTPMNELLKISRDGPDPRNISVDHPANNCPLSTLRSEDVAGTTNSPECKTDTRGEQMCFQDKLWDFIDIFTTSVKRSFNKYQKGLTFVFYGTICICILSYLTYACYRNMQEASVVLAITVLTILGTLVHFLRNTFSERFREKFWEPYQMCVRDMWRWAKWPFYFCFPLLVIGAVLLLTRGRPWQLVSACGLICFILVTYIFSSSPRHVKWRPVIWGLVIQFTLGIFIIRTNLGFIVFNTLGAVVTTFLGFSDFGAKFVFGDPEFQHHFLAFKILPIIIFFSSFISILYYLGVMQVVIKKIAWVMQHTMQTSASESLNAAGNIFIGQTEAPLLIRPMIPGMTRSELHAVMTGGFATVAGAGLGAYMSFGVSAPHLLSASLMSAPAALAISKLSYPEQEVSETKRMDEIDLPKGDERNIIEAASQGACTAIPLALNIAGNLIAFLALLALFNSLLGYLGGLVDVPQLSFEYICSYLFVPIAFLMGVDLEDCRVVAELVGIKTFINEFVAYEKLGELIKNRERGGPTLSARSEMIATYALCGFSNIGSIGIQLGGLTPIAPERRADLAELSIRALISGSIACFMTACVAGILYVPETDFADVLLNSTEILTTEITYTLL